MKLTTKTTQLVINLMMVLINDKNVINRKHLISWLKHINKNGTYTKKDRSSLNNLRGKYLEELKQYYIPLEPPSQEPYSVNVQVTGLSTSDISTYYHDTFQKSANPCGEIVIDSTDSIVTKNYLT